MTGSEPMLREALVKYRKAFAAANSDGDAGQGWDVLAKADDTARRALAALPPAAPDARTCPTCGTRMPEETA